MDLAFDLGGVIFSWEPGLLIRDVFDDSRTQAAVRTEILEHDDWRELDRGTLRVEDAVARASRRTGIPPDGVARFFAAVPDALVPLPASVDLLRSLRHRGHRLFYLSNMHAASAAHITDAYDLWGLFDGGLFSSDVGAVKPEEAIYRTFLQRYDLRPEGTLFIDDLPENVAAAVRCGLRGHVFRSAAGCRRALCSGGLL